MSVSMLLGLLDHPLVPAVAHNGVAALMVLLLTAACWRSSGAQGQRYAAASSSPRVQGMRVES